MIWLHCCMHVIKYCDLGLASKEQYILITSTLFSSTALPQEKQKNCSESGLRIQSPSKWHIQPEYEFMQWLWQVEIRTRVIWAERQEWFACIFIVAPFPNVHLCLVRIHPLLCRYSYNTYWYFAEHFSALNMPCSWSGENLAIFPASGHHKLLVFCPLCIHDVACLVGSLPSLREAALDMPSWSSQCSLCWVRWSALSLML